MGKEILSIADASQLLSLPEDEVERLLVAGELPGRRIGDHWFIARRRLLQFIAEGGPAHAPLAPVHLPAGNDLPERILTPGWRCRTCGERYGPEIAECPACGAVRNTPLMGYRWPGAHLNLGPKVN